MAYYNPHASLTLGEQIIENTMKFLFTNHQHCMPDAFFKYVVCVCVWTVLICLSFFLF